MLRILCTQQAYEEMNRQIDMDQAKIKLAYDAEGCGCIMSAMAQLWAVDKEDEFDHVSNVTYPILYDMRHEVFFEEEIQIDYIPHKKSFILKSKNQIYNAAMQLIEKRQPFI